MYLPCCDIISDCDRWILIVRKNDSLDVTCMQLVFVRNQFNDWLDHIPI
jgi:hypothetical protein